MGFYRANSSLGPRQLRAQRVHSNTTAEKKDSTRAMQILPFPSKIYTDIVDMACDRNLAAHLGSALGLNFRTSACTISYKKLKNNLLDIATCFGRLLKVLAMTSNLKFLRPPLSSNSTFPVIPSNCTYVRKNSSLNLNYYKIIRRRFGATGEDEYLYCVQI